MNIKKKLIITLFLFIGCNVFAADSIEDLIKNKSFYFDLQNSSGFYGGYISFNDGNITANYGVEYLRFEVDEYKIEKDGISIVLVNANFNVLGIPSFRNYEFPKYEKIYITKEQIKKRIENRKFNIIENDHVFVNKNTSAISICNNLRIREAPNTNGATRVVGKLSKWQKVVLIDCTKEKSKIENLEYPWYKVKLDGGTEGWGFGGFVKIYFDDEELEMLHKAFEKEGSEYTNQFVPPDNS